MTYFLPIIQPRDGKLRETAIALHHLFKPKETVDDCYKGLRGMHTNCNAWLGSKLINPAGSIYWRGDMARSWAVHYLRHYHQISDHFLSHEVGISDIKSTISSLMGREYNLPIIAVEGTTVTRNDEIVRCVWYSLDDKQLARGKLWNQAA